jgi:hypothetical protein
VTPSVSDVRLIAASRIRLRPEYKVKFNLGSVSRETVLTSSRSPVSSLACFPSKKNLHSPSRGTSRLALKASGSAGIRIILLARLVVWSLLPYSNINRPIQSLPDPRVNTPERGIYMKRPGMISWVVIIRLSESTRLPKWSRPPHSHPLSKSRRLMCTRRSAVPAQPGTPEPCLLRVWMAPDLL